MKIKRWMADEDAKLRSMCAEGRSCEEMATALGRNLQGIWDRKSKLGLITKDQRTIRLRNDLAAVAEIGTMLKDGMDWFDIAQRFDASVNAIRDIAKTNKLTRPHRRPHASSVMDATGRPRGYTAELVERVRTLICDRWWGVSDVSKEVGIAPERVRYLVQYYGMISPLIQRRWGAEETATLRQLLEDGADIDAIAKQLKRTDAAVISRCEFLGIHAKCPTILQRKRVLKNERFTLEKALKWKMSCARRRATGMGLDFTLTLPAMLDLFRQQSGRCHYTGTEMTFRPSEPSTFSIDRVDSDKGYTLDNVVLCLWDVNLMKQDLSSDRFYELCRLITLRASGHQSNGRCGAVALAA